MKVRTYRVYPTRIGILIAIAVFSRHGYPVSRRGNPEISFFASSGDKLVLLFRRGDRESISVRYERLHLRPDYEGLLGERQPTGAELHGEFAKENLPPVFVDTLEFTAFTLDQFKERMDRDAVSLVILASHRTKVLGKRLFDRLHALAEARSIPIIDQSDRILGQTAKPKGVEWTHDQHWNTACHPWVTEGVLDYLGGTPAICHVGGGSSSTSRTVQKSAPQNIGLPGWTGQGPRQA